MACSLDFFPENSSVFMVIFLVFFCMATVYQLEVSRSVVYAACCHMALVFALVRSCNISKFVLLLFVPFLYVFLNLLLIIRRKG